MEPFKQQDFKHPQYPEPLGPGGLPESLQSNGMARAAAICGVLSLVGLFFNASVFFGALGILFALLSRHKRFCNQAKAGLIMSISGIGIFLAMLAVSISILASAGLLKKYTDRVVHIDPNDPTAVTDIEEDLLNDLLKAYGIDPKDFRSSQIQGNSPIDPSIGHDTEIPQTGGTTL